MFFLRSDGVSVVFKKAGYYLKPKDSTSTNELPCWITEMDWYKEMRQDISLNANIFWLRSVFPKAECQEKIHQHSSSKSVFPTAENPREPQWYSGHCHTFFRSFHSLYQVELKTVCPANTFLILKPVWDAFCIITESSQVSFIFLWSVLRNWTSKKKHTVFSKAVHLSFKVWNGACRDYSKSFKNLFT